MSERQEGTIKNFSSRGYGFICRPHGRPDVFFHIRAVTNCEDEAEITPGRPVRFDICTKTDRPRAINVELLPDYDQTA